MRTAQKFAVGLVGLGMIFSSTVSRAQDILIVANKSVSISQLTSAQIRELFTGTKTRFSDGSHAVPVVLRGGPVHEVFLHRHVGDSPEEFRTRWRRLVFTGQGSMLKEFATEATMLEYITSTPGAIGYVSRVTVPDSVKILVVQR